MNVMLMDGHFCIKLNSNSRPIPLIFKSFHEILPPEDGPNSVPCCVLS